MELVRGRTLPQGLLGQAIDYPFKLWEALTRFRQFTPSQWARARAKEKWIALAD
jgi:hypothetical protein